MKGPIISAGRLFRLIFYGLHDMHRNSKTCSSRSNALFCRLPTGMSSWEGHGRASIQSITEGISLSLLLIFDIKIGKFKLVYLLQWTDASDQRSVKPKTIDNQIITVVSKQWIPSLGIFVHEGEAVCWTLDINDLRKTHSKQSVRVV